MRQAAGPLMRTFVVSYDLLVMAMWVTCVAGCSWLESRLKP